MTFSGRIISIFLICAILFGAPVVASSSEKSAPKKIAFVRDGDIWLMNDDGTRQRPLIKTKRVEVSPAWSPDGKRLAYLTSSGIWVTDSRGKRRKRLLKKRLGLENNIVFTPDGRYVARLYTVRRSKPPGASSPGSKYFGESGIEMINAGNGRVKRIPFFKGSRSGKPRRLAISPDGKMIVFDWFQTGLHTATVKGKGLKRITAGAEGLVEYASPIFSRDGKTVFAGYAEESGSRQSGFYAVNIEDNKVGQIKLENFPLTLSLSRGGESIVFDVMDPQTELTDTWISSLDGRDARKLAANAAMPAAQP